ncbi:hypothetical protein F5883DRAFT_101424 [Diaporthe sp. PMI_573]|nr:hypothetical protein F5883DRAFT_101424 [Diaporthaceae sp. PMI_573]
MILIKLALYSWCSALGKCSIFLCCGLFSRSARSFPSESTSLVDPGSPAPAPAPKGAPIGRPIPPQCVFSLNLRS